MIHVKLSVRRIEAVSVKPAGSIKIVSSEVYSGDDKRPCASQRRQVALESHESGSEFRDAQIVSSLGQKARTKASGGNLIPRPYVEGLGAVTNGTLLEGHSPLYPK